MQTKKVGLVKIHLNGEAQLTRKRSRGGKPKTEWMNAGGDTFQIHNNVASKNPSKRGELGTQIRWPEVPTKKSSKGARAS